MADETTSEVRIRLVGAVELVVDGTTARLPPQHEALLAVLGSHGGTASKDAVRQALWGSVSTETGARLRALATALRQHGAPVVDNSRQGRISWAPGVVTDLDPLWNDAGSAEAIAVAERIVGNDGADLFHGVVNPQGSTEFERVLQDRREVVVEAARRALASSSPAFDSPKFHPAPRASASSSPAPSSSRPRRAVLVGLGVLAVGAVGLLVGMAAFGADEQRSCRAGGFEVEGGMTCAFGESIRIQFWRERRAPRLMAPDPISGRDHRVTCEQAGDESRCRASGRGTVVFRTQPPRTLQTVQVVAGGAVPTFRDHTSAGGRPGPEIGAGQSVSVSCVTRGLRLPDGNTWYYRISSPGWDGRFYASADGFYNRPGQTEGTLRGTPFIDSRVRSCP